MTAPCPLIFNLQTKVKEELDADRLFDDVTARLLPPDLPNATAVIKAKEIGVFFGSPIVQAFQGLGFNVRALVPDGKRIEKGEPVVEIQAPATVCLGIERTLLNYLGLLSGTATLTRRYVDEVGRLPTKILATRKTIPGLRDLQLQAVVSGGGWVHRRSLSDGILIKENHIALTTESAVLRKARLHRSPLHKVEIEVQSWESLEEVLKTPPDVIMLDNFDLANTRLAVERIGNTCEIEVSGGIRLDQVRPLAELGVHYISVGKLTHSAPSLDLSLDFLTASPPGSGS